MIKNEQIERWTEMGNETGLLIGRLFGLASALSLKIMENMVAPAVRLNANLETNNRRWYRELEIGPASRADTSAWEQAKFEAPYPPLGVRSQTWRQYGATMGRIGGTAVGTSLDLLARFIEVGFLFPLAAGVRISNRERIKNLR